MRSSIAILGRGRVGAALARAFGDVTILGRDAGQALSSLPRGTLLFLAVPETSLPKLAPSLRAHVRRLSLIGVSGSLDPSAFAELGLGRVGTFHPLMTFARGRAERLRGVPIAVSSAALARLARSIGAVPFRVPRQRALYHAAAVMAAAGLVATLATAQELLMAAGLGASEALGVLSPIARRSLENAVAMGPGAALTGPVARGDPMTVRAHRSALRAATPAALPVYDALTEKMRRLLASSPAAPRARSARAPAPRTIGPRPNGGAPRSKRRPAG